MIDPLKRIQLPEVLSLIDDKRYFILHAPRQTGKTTCLLAMVDYLNQQGQYHALYVNIEGAQTVRHSVEEGMATVCSVTARMIRLTWGKDHLAKKLYESSQNYPAQDRYYALLSELSMDVEKPVVLFLDEVDALVGDTLVSLFKTTSGGLQLKAQRLSSICGPLQSP